MLKHTQTRVQQSRCMSCNLTYTHAHTHTRARTHTQTHTHTHTHTLQPRPPKLTCRRDAQVGQGAESPKGLPQDAPLASTAIFGHQRSAHQLSVTYDIVCPVVWSHKACVSQLEHTAQNATQQHVLYTTQRAPAQRHVRYCLPCSMVT